MSVFTNDWSQILSEELEKEYYKKLREFLKKEYAASRVFPDMYDIYAAFNRTAYEDTKVVIIGQDPYHGEGQAHGYSFSVPKGVDIPPSLKNIYKELQEDIGMASPPHGNLEAWADEGVLLLNNVLTVQAHKAHSHKEAGWEVLTDKVIEVLNQRERPLVFILWGRPAQKKAEAVNRDRHCVIQSPHPSPLSAYRGFFGSRPFSRANQFLESVNQKPVDWQSINKS
ncbi:uracil-DNA glycosylase [Halobacillus sp. A5]|uniref:uracil-DNA glycosylase n=1 Tax=Halobacillus sp. A5 TaxID=2880263 RepID=UPI0020A63F87|nr:uracil-DNA glycosylase [Halobacillus sp. A5]MCP3025918.1 uracil-DNA glycosylase [Halobacillus sp. A5]